MEQLLNHFVNFINSLPLWLQVIAVFGFIPVAYVLFNLVTKKDFRDDMVEMIIKKSHRRTIKEVFGHPIFGGLDRYKSLVQKVNCDNTKKSYIISYLNVRFESFYSKLNKFVNDALINEDNLNEKSRSYIDEVNADTEQLIKTRYRSLMDSKLYSDDNVEEVFNLINLAYKDIDSSNILFLTTVINTLNNNHIAYNERLYIFLNILNVYFDVNAIDVPDVASKINGQLDKLLSKATNTHKK